MGEQTSVGVSGTAPPAPMVVHYVLSSGDRMGSCREVALLSENAGVASLELDPASPLREVHYSVAKALDTWHWPSLCVE